MHINTIVLAALASVTSATQFASLALRSASPVHFQPIQARELGLWVGGETESFCPRKEVKDCPPGNVTSIIIDKGQASMNTEVPGGQALYVTSKGSFEYTEAHSAAIPKGAYSMGFMNIPGQDGSVNTWTFLGGGATGLFACVQGKDKKGYDVYKLYADVKGADLPKSCLEIGALRDHYKGVAAWQYE